MPHDTLQTEKELLKRIAGHDQQAFAEIVNYYWNNVYSQALAYCKSSHLAQDIVQDVFLKIWVKRVTLADIESFEDYLFIVARNQIISVFRRKISEPVEDSTMYTGLHEKSWLPDEQLSLKQSQEIVDKAIELLPAQRKTVFRLSRMEGLSYIQIAENMGISRNTVKEHIVKARNFLRTYLRTHSDISLLLVLLTLIHSPN